MVKSKIMVILAFRYTKDIHINNIMLDSAATRMVSHFHSWIYHLINDKIKKLKVAILYLYKDKIKN